MTRSNPVNRKRMVSAAAFLGLLSPSLAQDPPIPEPAAVQPLEIISSFHKGPFGTQVIGLAVFGREIFALTAEDTLFKANHASLKWAFELDQVRTLVRTPKALWAVRRRNAAVPLTQPEESPAEVLAFEGRLMNEETRVFRTNLEEVACSGEAILQFDSWTEDGVTTMVALCRAQLFRSNPQGEWAAIDVPPAVQAVEIRSFSLAAGKLYAASDQGVLTAPVASGELETLVGLEDFPRGPDGDLSRHDGDIQDIVALQYGSHLRLVLGTRHSLFLYSTADRKPWRAASARVFDLEMADDRLFAATSNGVLVIEGDRLLAEARGGSHGEGEIWKIAAEGMRTEAHTLKVAGALELCGTIAGIFARRKGRDEEWIPLANGLEGAAVFDIEYHESPSETLFFVATSRGVFKTVLDAQRSWNELGWQDARERFGKVSWMKVLSDGDMAHNPHVRSISVSPKESLVVALTSAGVWLCPLGGAAERPRPVRELPEGLWAEQFWDIVPVPHSPSSFFVASSQGIYRMVIGSEVKWSGPVLAGKDIRILDDRGSGLLASGHLGEVFWIDDAASAPRPRTLNTASLNSVPTSLFADAGIPDLLLVGTKEGLYWSEDKGVSFQHLESLDLSDVRAILRTHENRVLAATSSGVFALRGGMLARSSLPSQLGLAVWITAALVLCVGIFGVAKFVRRRPTPKLPPWFGKP